ncbi:MAG TPA: zincin-like metallopeptidase domain-containing protein, partial [Candidatus Deferrimicrobiaceae bacterium]|nr:zincin-like metallopeptidase domain-containing protein [Candidatus Deferrimicrobiaceae bacterium]
MWIARQSNPPAAYELFRSWLLAGAAFLCADLGITPEIRDDHAAHLGHWLQVPKEDKRAIFSAAAHATRRRFAWLAAAGAAGRDGA